jgi:hypothetical protein
MNRRLLGLVVLIGLLYIPAGFAQDTGVITGTVRDNSGAVVPGAEVKVSSRAGGVDRTTTTNSSGDYLAAGLPGGTYDLIISAKGFKTFKADGIVLRVAQKARIDADLQVGQVATEVTVEGAQLNQVETQSSELAGTVTGKQITQLELNGRNYTQLVALTPGATNQSGTDEPGTGVSTVAYSVNGGRTEYNNWEVDGGSNQDDGSNTTLIAYPSLEAIAEVRVLTSNYGAQYGKNGSGTVEVQTKSGTSAFHGNVYEFVRNDDFNARNYFLSSVPTYKKNDFGYTIGGPIFIPGHYNTDKSKTFFFWSQEWRRDVVPGANFNTITPTAAERGCPGATSVANCTPGAFGDFSDLCPGSDCPVDPNTGLPYPGNLVPIDPLAVPLLPMFPLPTPGLSPHNFVDAPSQLTTWREELLRADHNINSKWHATFRYIHDSWNSVTPNPLWTNGGSYPTIQDAFIQPSTSMVARLTTVASPTLLNEFVASYSVNHISFQNLGAWQRPPGYNIGLFQNGFGGGKLPGVQLNGGFFDTIAQDAGYVPNGPLNSNPVYTFRDNVSKIVGRHNLQFGGSFIASQKNELPQFEPSVNGFLTFDVGSAVTTGNAFADLLTGRISTFAQGSDQPKYYLRHKIFEPYFQDDWRVTDRLTLNLGLRISMFGTSRDAKKQAFNFDPASFVPGASFINPDGSVGGNPFNGIVQCGVNHVPIGCYPGHLFNPAPRIGFAWDPHGDGKTAIRGGYGIFFEYTNGNEATATALEGSPPLVTTPTQSNIVGYSNIGVAGENFPLTVVSLPSKAQWPYIAQWHLDWQHEFPENFVAVISYVGSKGTHLGRRRDLNQLHAVPNSLNPYLPGEAIDSDSTSPTFNTDCTNLTVNGVAVTGQVAQNLSVVCGGSPDFFRPFLGFSDIRALENKSSSIYNAMQASLRKTVGSLQLSMAYTWSHSIDDLSSGGDTGFVDSYNFASNRASSNFDQRHVFTMSYVYDLPFFKTPGLTKTLLGGWQWSGITTVQTGAPFSVYNGGAGSVPGDNAGVGNGVGTGSYPDLISDPTQGIPHTTGGPGFGPLFGNPAAFVAPRGLTFGDAGRNILRNPRQTNFDMALFKHFAIKERLSFEFRAEAFNVFNHTQWGYIGGGGGSAANNSAISSFTNSVGCNNSQADFTCSGLGFLSPNGAHNPRILQLGLKLIF